jgi:DNA-binding MurR/RpiR family transcriptional regulator
LSTSQKVVADYVLANPEKVMLNTLSEIAEICGVSETTVLRFLHKIDFKSYQLFRINLTQELSSNDSVSTTYEDVKFSDSIETIIEKVVLSTSSAVQDTKELVDYRVIEEVIRKITSARKVVIIGVGASGAIAIDFFHKLLKLGIETVYSNDAHMINMLTINMQKEDMLIVFSHSGESREVLDAVTIAKERGVCTCAITSYEKSTLSRNCDLLVCSSSVETSLRSDAMVSRIIQMVIIDIIYVSIIVKKGDAVLSQIHNSRLAVAKNKI